MEGRLLLADDPHGTFVIFTGPNCIGKSKLLTGSVADLGAFDREVASVLLG